MRASTCSLRIMAKLVVTDEEVSVELTTKEHLLSMHKSFGVPRGDVTSIDHVDDVLSEVQGHKVTGEGLPETKLGTFESPDGTDFCAVKGHGPGTVVTLRDGAQYRRILVSDE
jgi:hypothetical protein